MTKVRKRRNRPLGLREQRAQEKAVLNMETLTKRRMWKQICEALPNRRDRITYMRAVIQALTESIARHKQEGSVIVSPHTGETFKRNEEGVIHG